MTLSRDSAEPSAGAERESEHSPLEALLSVLTAKRPVLIQTHDFPDHDAVGAAFGLCELLSRRGFSCSIAYGGSIQSISLSEMIKELNIELIPLDVALQARGDTQSTAGSPAPNSAQMPGNAQTPADAQTIVVDGSPASGTVRAVAGHLTAVIDHHPARKRLSVPFADVRLDVGSCAAIVWTYWKEAGEEPEGAAATALLAGIQLDTDFLSRRVSKTDLDAHHDLFFRGNHELARAIVRTSLSVDQLADIARAFSSVRVTDGALLAEVSGDYPAELLSVLADFLLRLREVSFVVVIEVRGPEFRLSARTRDRAIDTGHVIRHALAGIGSGGGHPHMAGGIIKPERYPGGDAFLARIVDEIAACRSQE
jgi:nanoRNase/pAp phosphatase (c-di-AMP/oligoRNAs hydrolase)